MGKSFALQEVTIQPAAVPHELHRVSGIACGTETARKPAARR